jgi:hypothetical protein
MAGHIALRSLILAFAAVTPVAAAYGLKGGPLAALAAVVLFLEGLAQLLRPQENALAARRAALGYLEAVSALRSGLGQFGSAQNDDDKLRILGEQMRKIQRTYVDNTLAIWQRSGEPTERGQRASSGL